ncbi:YggS family pyridoxal phosphate-dependent enzyme [Legionella geestiana]|uniref:YggS family pyridoxal phosphate-dependent enzyme n=1 Tax=Legionella geestiana TaxID=45065 RepID=UPI001091998B|nr:YggS family pyridoxal phosphate-dependent enzyme [Legionella geestiana]QDQ40344.1 YggS family pyridoxal phosphate-dependent enzyme [Legionella geestiana]
MTIAMRVQAVLQRLRAAEKEANRSEGAVSLLAVSKGQTVGAIREAFAAGLSAFGENRCQEALVKMQALQDLPITWHFIGPLQSNKLKRIAQSFDWVHSVASLEAAEKLADNRPTALPPLNICLQINLDAEAQKAGISPSEAHALAEAVSKPAGLCLRGLMCIPTANTSPERQYAAFKRLADLMESLNRDTSLALDTLSMGMSADMVLAVIAGSTIVRIGRALFGEEEIPAS